MPAAGETIAAVTAHDVTLAADYLSGKEVRDIGPDAHDLSHELVPDMHRYRDRLLRPVVPVVDVNVGAADGRSLHTNKYVVDPDLRVRYIVEPEAGLCILLNDCFHGYRAATARERGLLPR